jgi:predicted small lipoprotein YifL
MGAWKMIPSGLRTLLPSLLILLTIVGIAGCGKKGPPTLKSYEKPVAPANPGAIHREDEIHLFWHFPKDKEITIRNFVILRSSGSEFARIAETGNDKRSFSDKDFILGISYIYKVLSQNHRGTLSNDENIITVRPGAVPEPPDVIKFQATDNSIQLKWQAQSRGILFNVYKSHEKNIYGLQPVNKTPLNDTSFNDSFDLRKTVYYTVRSLSDISIRNESRSSSELVVDPLEFIPSQPTGLRSFPSSERIYLTWNEPVEAWVTGFRIYRSTGGGDYLLTAETQIPAYIDQDKSEGKRDYRIHAVGPLKEGPGAGITGIFIDRTR